MRLLIFLSGMLFGAYLTRFSKNQHELLQKSNLPKGRYEIRLDEGKTQSGNRHASVATQKPLIYPKGTKSSSTQFELVQALTIAEAALGDIGDAEREPGDDVAWCESRALDALMRIRPTMSRLGIGHS